MARLGVTYQDIANAAHQLLGQGKQPTIELIRHFLGTGSSTTIANHLRKWRAEQDGSLSLSRTENIPQEMITLMKGLWERLNYQAQEKIIALETHYQHILHDNQQELQKYKSNNQRWQQMFNHWTQEKEKLVANLLSLEQQVESLQKGKAAQEIKLEGQQEQLQEKQQRIVELHHLLTQAQANLEHDRESTREQRLLEQQQFEQQKDEWQAKLKSYKEQMAAWRDKTTSLQQDYRSLQHISNTLEEKNTQMESLLEKVRTELTKTEKMSNEHLQSSKHWQDQYKEAQKNLEANTTQFIDIQAKTTVLSEQLSETKQSLADALDQNKLFGHEKWILSQEKAQLEGQLKQMQKMTNT